MSNRVIHCPASLYRLARDRRFSSPPFISAHLIDSADVKALEFSGRTHANYIDRTDKTQSEHPFLVFKNGAIDLRGANIEEIIVDERRWGVDGVPDLAKVFKEGGEIELKDGNVIFMADGKKIEFRPGQNLDEILFNHVESKDHKIGREVGTCVNCSAFQPRHATEPYPGGRER